MNNKAIEDQINRLDPKFGHALWHALKYKQGQLYHIYMIVISMANAKEMDKDEQS